MVMDRFHGGLTMIGPKKNLNYFNTPKRAAYLFILPAMVTLVCFVFIPLISAIVISFMDMTIYLDSFNFVELKNYIKLFSDERFFNALKNTMRFIVWQMPIQVVLGLLVAAFLSVNTKFRKFLRSVFFIPTVCSLTAVSIVWSFLLDGHIGILPYYLTKLGFPILDFLRDPHLAMPTVILMTVWKNFGMTMVILVAGIQGISQTYYEAAQIDGANKVNLFFKITIPMIVPTIGFCVVTNTIGSFQVFDQIYVMTQGGPMFSTETLVMYIYNVGFKSQPYNLSYASAIAVILFVIILVISLTMKHYFNKKETVQA